MKISSWLVCGLGCVLVSALWMDRVQPLSAVGPARAAEAATQAPTAQPAADKDAVARGEIWFYQRCSLCHMERIVKDEVFMPLGPRLKGLLKDAPARAPQIRAFIKVGTLRMPGFQYGLDDKELDEIIAFLKTF